MLSKRDSQKEEKTFKVKWIYQALGITKQAYYKRQNTDNKQASMEAKVINLVNEKRKKQVRMGTRKLQQDLKDEFLKQGIKVGRDALFTLLRKQGMLVKRTKRFFITTDSKHYFYTSPNLLKELDITHSEQAFVSDITYISIENKHAYLALVTDAYSKKIMGWNLQDNMKVSLVKDALKMAYKNTMHNNSNIIHHSDRGIQYCCPDFTDFAKQKGFLLSTTQKYDPYENAIAERINGILKYEFGLKRTIPNISIAKKMVAEAIAIYNHERLHWSLDLKTPEQVHKEYNKQKYKSYAKKVA